MRITTAQNDIQSVLFTAEQLQARIQAIAAELKRDYGDKLPTLVCILKGASFFFVDLCKALNFHIHLDFVSVSSYGAASASTGVVRIIKDLDTPITGRDVLIVEDIIDSGLTLQHLITLLSARNPASIKTVCLLDKQARRRCDINADYCGFQIPDEFVVGYGLDYAEYYRNLPYVGILKPEVYL